MKALIEAQELAFPLSRPMGTRSRPIRIGDVVRTSKGGRSYAPKRFKDPKVSYSETGERHVRFNKREAYRSVEDLDGNKHYVNSKVADWFPEDDKPTKIKPKRRRR